MPGLEHPDKKVFFPNLDGLRFVAFATVFLYHSNDQWAIHFPQFTNVWHRFVSFTLNMGSEGVSVFFVLSGFLITYLIINEKETGGHFNILHFYLRRALRIWPLYYLIVLLNFTVFAWLCKYLDWQSTIWNPAMVLLFLTNFNVLELKKLGANHHTLLGPTWSVAIEEQFYIIWPVIFLFTKRSFYKYALVAIIVISYLFRFLYRHNNDALYYNTLSVCGDLAAGGLTAWYAYYSAPFRQYVKSMKKGLVTLIYLIGILWLYFVLEVSHSASVAFLFRMVNCAFYAFIIIEQNYCDNSFFKFSSGAFISKWGKYTYGLYMWHIVVIILLRVSLQRLAPGFDTGLFVNELIFRVVALMVTMGLSYVSYHYYEKIFLNLKARFSKIKTPASYTVEHIPVQG